MLASGRIDGKALITHRFPLARILEAVAAQTGSDALKVILKP
jgi:threonine dehydrogenase-like Zn-dependent dehydrogenase